MNLEELANKTSYTSEEKKYLRELAKKNVIDFKPSHRCENCYNDLVIQLAVKSRTDEASEPTDANYILKDGIDFWFGGTKRVHQITMTDKLGKELIDAGLSKFFKKYPADANQV